MQSGRLENSWVQVRVVKVRLLPPYNLTSHSPHLYSLPLPFTRLLLTLYHYPSGAEGDAGRDGLTPAPGVEGIRGERGPDGVQGPVGGQGAIGDAGEDGAPGMCKIVLFITELFSLWSFPPIKRDKMFLYNKRRILNLHFQNECSQLNYATLNLLNCFR